MSNNLTPLQVCERLIGPFPVITAILGYGDKAAYGWVRPSKRRCGGDLPSAGIMRALLTHSTAHGLGLTADHLIWGASEAEVAAILAARQPRLEAAE